MKIGTATVVLLVMLRMGAGCHFLYEGVWKIKHPEFSAEGFLRQAKGPAAPLFHAFIPDMDGRRRLKIEKAVAADNLVASWRKVCDNCETRLTGPFRDRLKAYEAKRKKTEDGKLSAENEDTVRRLENKIDRLTLKFERLSEPILWEAEDKLETFLAKNENAILAYFATPPAERKSPGKVEDWLTQIARIQQEYVAALKKKDYAKADQELGGLKAELESAIGRSVGALQPVYQEGSPVEKLASVSGIRNPNGGEVLRVAELIRADKFYKPYAKLKQDVIRKYHLNADQQYQADRIYRRYKDAAIAVLAENQADIAVYFEALKRFEEREAIGNNGAAHQLERGHDERQKLLKEVGVWLSGLKASGEGYQTALAGLLTKQQAAKGALPVPWKLMDYMNFAVTYGLSAIGLCLLLGLFTRPAALAAGCFMVSIVLTQPAWPTIYPPDPPMVGHALLINKDFIEMLVLFTLASTAVGRWAGLDYFVENYIVSLWGKLQNKSNQQEDKS